MTKIIRAIDQLPQVIVQDSGTQVVVTAPGPQGTVTAALQALADAADASADVAVAASEASGNVLFFDTKAAAEAALSGLSEQQIVEVLVDESYGDARTRYRVETGALVFKLALNVTYPRTAAEIAVSVTPVNFDYPECNVLRYGTNTTPGTTDMTSAIQTAIDVSTLGGARCVVRIPAGVYRTTDTIHIGYGEAAFQSCVVEGEGYAYAGVPEFNGTSILADFNDRPCVNFQGARGSVLRSITLRGLNREHITDNGLGYLEPTLDDTDGANWVDPTFPAASDSRYAPYAGVTIDAYSGTAPATAYPEVTYPASLGTVAQYGKAFSSDVLLEDVYITGFVVGVVNQPCDADGNADFTALRRVTINECRYGLSIGNSQSRNVLVDHCKMAALHTGFVNKVHGKQIGKLHGTINNLSAGGMTQLIDIDTTYGGPLTFLHLYAEYIWRIGRIVAASSNENAIIFQSCKIGFEAQEDFRGIPAATIYGVQQPVYVVFKGCQLDEFPSVLPLLAKPLSIEETALNPNTRGDGAVAAYIAQAHNGLAGGLVTLNLKSGGEPLRVKFRQIDLDTNTVGNAKTLADGYRDGTRKYCLPIYASTCQPYEEAFSYTTTVPRYVENVAKSALTSVDLTGKTLTIVFNGRLEWQFGLYGPDVGDVIYDDQTAMTFFVSARTGTTVTAIAQNNYKDDGAGGYTTVEDFSTTVGNFYFASTRVYSLPYYFLGDMTSGSAVITNCGRADGYSEWFDNHIAVDDYLYCFLTAEYAFGAANAKVVARDQSAATVTLDDSAYVTMTKRQFPLWVRKPPANA